MSFNTVVLASANLLDYLALTAKALNAKALKAKALKAKALKAKALTKTKSSL